MRIFSAVLILMTLTVFAGAQTYYGSTDLKIFREGRDKELRDKTESPLTETDFAVFKGLNYFPINRKFRIKAAFTRTVDEKYFQMPTSSGETKKFIKFGVVKFKLDGRDQSLNVYQIDPVVLAKFPEYADLLFIPFRDLTSGKETYGVGRYIDIKAPKGKKVLLDFNLAYNPNCAYGSDKYSCPIPPKENFLRVEIKAGEKSFTHAAK